MKTEFYILLGVAAMVAAAMVWMVRRQKSLRRRAELMQEAVANHDFTFRLPTDGLLPGERAMQEALNQLGTIVRQQVNQNEVESWERLTRVLTHEIMNAMAPIVSLSQSMLSRSDVKGTPVEEGLQAIHSTSRHLNDFVDNYRKMSQLQKPRAEDCDIVRLVHDVAQAYPTLTWTYSDATAGSFSVHTDPGMLRQVMINLTKNAIEAGATSMGIALSLAPRTVQLCLSNDGQMIPPEVRSSVFIPFFTTKRSGNGIGLSLSRRMLSLQGGDLELAERPRDGYHTTFIVTLPHKQP